MLRNLRIERMKHWIVTKDHRTEHAKQHEKNDLNTEPWNLNNIKTWNLSGVRGCLASCLPMFVTIFFAISRGEDSSADGASSLRAHGLDRWRTATHSGHGIGHIAGIPRISLIVYNTSEDGRAISNKIYFFEPKSRLCTFHWSILGLCQYCSRARVITLSTRRLQYFFHRSSKVNWHVPPFLTLFDSSARKILFHTMANIQLSNLLVLVGFDHPCDRSLIWWFSPHDQIQAFTIEMRIGASTPQESGISALFLGLTPTLAGLEKEKSSTVDNGKATHPQK